MKLWGVIAEVNEKDIIVSLPGGLRGLVRASDAFDPISSDEVNGVFSPSTYISKEEISANEMMNFVNYHSFYYIFDSIPYGRMWIIASFLEFTRKGSLYLVWFCKWMMIRKN